MCGLAGVACLNSAVAAAEQESIVRDMCDLQAHRGPDDAGLTNLGRACLGSRRLSILDLSQAGHMPMSDDTGRWWICYNGEIYNFQEIREELLNLGHTFRSRTDTEVVLYAYIQWGYACLERFIGMFAFAIADASTGEVTLVRDRYGIKPLYYAPIDQHVFFCSEMKALVRVLKSPRVDKHSLMEWLLYRNVDTLTRETLIEGIYSVLPGQIVRVGNQGITTTQYYSPISHVSETVYRAYEAARVKNVIDEVDATLKDATRQRLVSDVPVGTLLSGGLDSSLITAIASEYTNDLTCFHVAIEGFSDLDERRYAEHLAKSRGLRLVSYALTAKEFRRTLPWVTYLSDLPLSHPNTVAYFLISSVAREHQVAVLLSGEGADELFGGYSWNYRRKRMLLRVQPLLRLIPEKLHGILALLVYTHAQMPVSSHRFRELLPPTVDLLDRYARLDWAEQCENAYSFIAHHHDRAVLGSMLADLNDFLSPLLRRLDRASMGASVECRVPYLDHRLVHKVINFPLDYRVGRHSDKWILKQVARRHIPEGLVKRKKMGFPLPLQEYLSPLADMAFFDGGFCEGTLGLSRRGLARLLSGWHRWTSGFFGLVTLEIWGRLHFMGESAEQIAARIEHLELRQRVN